MKIVEVCYNHPAEVFIQRHVAALQARRDVEIVLIARHRLAAYANTASVQDRVVHGPSAVMPNYDHLSAASKLTNLKYLVSARGYLTRPLAVRDKVLLGYFRSLRPDLIHFHTATLAAAMSWIPKALRIPYTLSLRGSDIQVEPLLSAEKQLEIVNALNGATAIHTISDLLGRKAKGLAPQSRTPVTIYTTVPVAGELPAHSPPASGRLDLLTVGRLHWTKSYVDLLVALRGLIDAGAEAHLMIVGSGPDQDRLRFWVDRLGLQGNIEWAGKQSFDEIQNLFTRSHAYVQSSIAEGFGNAMAEAMAWGCPVFATDICGISELIQQDAGGFLLPTADPGKWPALLQVASDHEYMAVVREKAYMIARKVFAANIHGARFVEFYRQALDVARSPSASLSSFSTIPTPTENYRPRILIWGPWEWPHGADLILRAFRAFPLNQVQIELVGSGTQEDELRYLVDWLGMSQAVTFTHWADNQEKSWSLQPHHPMSAEFTIDITERFTWRIFSAAGQRNFYLDEARSLGAYIHGLVSSGSVN